MVGNEVKVWVIAFIIQFISAGFFICTYYVPGPMLDYKDIAIDHGP